MLSPLLFILYVNKLIDMCKCSGNNGLFVDEQFQSVCALLYADDMTQMSDLVGHLQKLIDCLSEYCHDWGMSVNFNKTKVVVFRNEGIIKQIEKWYLQGHLSIRISVC